ncbi:PREDICTED: uncharacterized protein LOC104788243 isoform X2 [Camelina sativa]|uniref:Uncharacterized protein LOC104788243 isoform X2 n=1 Tax=Camelina sativa TaxID=90675 RepID=A0ABM1RRS9_CAMSA|nr:PREDICTED: uncharacterized protein LOC104788243 isoform X2 [Camelina sativa]
MSSALPLKPMLPLTTTSLPSPFRSDNPNFYRRRSSSSTSCSSQSPSYSSSLFSVRRRRFRSSSPSSIPMIHDEVVVKFSFLGTEDLMSAECFPEHTRDQEDDVEDIWISKEDNVTCRFESDEDTTTTALRIPTQAQAIVEGPGSVTVSELQPTPDVDYIQELLAIQQQGPRSIGFFGTRNMGFMHQELIQILSYAMVITKNHIYTSGASGTNAAVIRGALRAERPELLTVILPQSLKKQPPESQELLSKVQNVIEKPHNDHLPLLEASRLCNMDIISQVQQIICFAFHDSKLLMETCQEAKNLRKIVTLFYLD